MTSKLHSELQKQLDAASGPVQAVVQFRNADDKQAIPSPAEASQLAKRVFDRVAKKVGYAAIRTNVMSNIASAVVEADPTYVQALIEQPEVVSAMPNQTSQDPRIAPRGKRPVE